MKVKITLLSLLLFVIFISSSYGETLRLDDSNDYIFELIDREDGLSNLSISNIIQDKYGFMWFATQGGLNYYNGNEIKVFRTNAFDDSGLVHNLIQTMFYDEELHEIWIGTYQGISRYVIEDNKFKNYTVEGNNLSNPVVTSITKDDYGNIWVGTLDGLNKLEKDSSKFEQIDIPGKTVRDLLLSSRNQLILGTYDGLYSFDRTKGKLEKFQIELPSPYVMVVKEFEDNLLTLGLWDGGIVEFNTDTMKVDVKEYPDNRIYSILKSIDNSLWIGTWGGGLFVEDSGKISHYGTNSRNSNISHDVVYSIYEDQNGIIWIGTNGGGINKVNPAKKNFVVLKYDEDDETSLSSGKVNCIYEDKEGYLWIALYNNGIDRYNPKTGELKKYKEENNENNIPNNQTNDFIEIDGVLYAGTNGGLAYYDKNKDSFLLYPDIPSDRLIYALEYVNDYELWVGTYTHGLLIHNLFNGEVRSYESDDTENPIADNLVYDILEDSKGRVWVATNNGLNLKDDNQEEFRVFRKEKGNYKKLANNTIRSVYEDSKGKIWISMVGGGLAYFVEEDSSFVSFTEEDGLPSNVVLSTVEDSAGSMWCSTENGIAILKPTTQEIYSLTPNDGIGSWEFSSDIIRTRNSSIVLGGVSGITSIPEDIILSKSKEPKVYIEDVLLFNESIDENRQFFNDANLEFAANETSIEFRIAALDYDSNSVHFLYKLEGFDEDWVRSGNRNYISYSNLPAGNYEFKVIAETDKDVVSSEVRLNLAIKKRWYRTNFAYFSYFVLLIVIFKGLVKLREGQLLKETNSELASLNRKLECANIELEKISTRDPLTDLYNRRYFDVMFSNHLNMAMRSGSELSLIMIDVDDFKDVNDKFGHMAGDMVLNDIANQIRTIINRSTDFIVRFGGDEFLIVLFDTDCKNVNVITKQIIESINLVQVPEKFTTENVPITVSIGVGCMTPQVQDTVQDYIEMADQALYNSKKDGKNCVTIKTRTDIDSVT